ncbi:unnamed protein product [Lota lota]
MELKVWVDGVVRVVCGLSYTTSCQDVVIALAQAIGQTGRYILILKLKGTERQLNATACPLQAVAQLGQQATEVQFILRRTGQALSDGPDGSKTERQLLLPRQSEPPNLGPSHPRKALSFHLDPSTFPRRKKTRDYSPSPRASPEPRASPVSFQEPVYPVKTCRPHGSKEETFRQILNQQERLHDLEMQLQALEFELQECERSSCPTPVLTPSLAEDMEELEMRTRQNDAELMHGGHWEEQLQVELDLEQDMHRRLDTISSFIDNDSYRIQDLQAHSAQLRQDLQLEESSQAALQQSEDLTLLSLKQELQSRLQQGNELAALLMEKEKELQAVNAMLEDRYQLIEECNKDLRQCNLQQFIQQAGVTSGPPDTDLAQWDHPHPPPPSAHYLFNAGILEDDLTETVSVC